MQISLEHLPGSDSTLGTLAGRDLARQLRRTPPAPTAVGDIARVALREKTLLLGLRQGAEQLPTLRPSKQCCVSSVHITPACLLSRRPRLRQSDASRNDSDVAAARRLPVTPVAA
eukprot:Gregarina_sp_Pseudo_9__5897@NODE_930_length_2054_cov_31_879901_g872_i0_p4_GENE_NODE_930_length_2054_cov_31_879901_g872_i0NODE_930_length_2054_cov_31_879901_g872_i0_p4_ORF_typecomplete_len115_score7_22_NODE_930_length_2054_cov_31_879901_g872_i015161860